MENKSEVYELELPEALAGERLDRALAALLPDLSRTRIQFLIRAGKISVDGRAKTVPRESFPAGSRVVVENPPQDLPEKAEPEDIPLDVMYEDDSLLVVNKAAGMVVHPAAGNWRGTLVNAVLGRAPEGLMDDEEFNPLRPGIVHRLDKDTSGALVVAKTPRALRRLAKAFADRAVSKTYLAIVHGVPSPAVNVVNLPIARHPSDRRRMTVARPGTGREAMTTWKLIRSGVWEGQKVSLMEIRLHTGRTHQIRVHMSHAGWPLVGESLYARGRSSSAPRQMLHAWKLSFPHPETGETLSFEAPIPDDFRVIANAILDKR